MGLSLLEQTRNELGTGSAVGKRKAEDHSAAAARGTTAPAEIKIARSTVLQCLAKPILKTSRQAMREC